MRGGQRKRDQSCTNIGFSMGKIENVKNENERDEEEMKRLPYRRKKRQAEY